MIRALVLSAAPAIAAGILASVPIAHADPDQMGTNCESNFWGSLYCDGPVRPDGTWTRCVTTQQQLSGGFDSNPPILIPSIHKCYPVDPAAMPFGQPDHHIGLDP